MNRQREMNEKLKVLWELFLNTGSSKELIAFVNENPEFMRTCEHEYPVSHRIVDFTIAEQSYRVTRCVACHEELTIAPITSAEASQEQGVPYSLTGVQLRKWVADEERNPSKGPCDWKHYQVG